MSAAKTVREYIATAPAASRPHLRSLRRIIRAAAPKAQERLSYGMPYYHYHGRLAYFAGYADYCGFYMIPKTLAGFREEIKRYQTSKSTLRFPVGAPIPVALVRAIVRTRARENEKNKH